MTSKYSRASSARATVPAQDEGKKERYVQAAEVRHRLGGICDMTLWRIQNDEAFDFPKPFKMNNRRYWLETELEAWILKMPARLR